MIRKDIPLLLKNRRKELNLTLEEAGKILGVSKTTYRDYENGVLLVKNMKLEKLVPLSLYLDMLPNNLFDFNIPTEHVELNREQFKAFMTKAIIYTAKDLSEEEKNYLIKSVELICK